MLRNPDFEMSSFSLIDDITMKALTFINKSRTKNVY